MNACINDKNECQEMERTKIVTIKGYVCQVK